MHVAPRPEHAPLRRFDSVLVLWIVHRARPWLRRARVVETGPGGAAREHARVGSGVSPCVGATCADACRRDQGVTNLANAAPVMCAYTLYVVYSCINYNVRTERFGLPLHQMSNLPLHAARTDLDELESRSFSDLTLVNLFQRDV